MRKEQDSHDDDCIVAYVKTNTVYSIECIIQRNQNAEYFRSAICSVKLTCQFDEIVSRPFTNIIKQTLQCAVCSNANIHKSTTNVSYGPEYLRSLKANEQVEKEALVTLLVRYICNGIQYILCEREELITNTEKVELLKVCRHKCPFEETEARVALAASGMRTVTE